jgi:hypothetical protein
VQTTVIFKRQNSSDFHNGLPPSSGGAKLVTRGIAFEGGDDLSSPLVADEDNERRVVTDSVLTFHPLGNSNSRATLQTISSFSSGGGMGEKSSVAAKSGDKAQDDDDLMSFLEDDSNF